MKTLLAIVLVGTGSMVGLLEVGIQRGVLLAQSVESPDRREPLAGDMMASTSLSAGHRFFATPALFGATGGGRGLSSVTLGGPEDPGDFPAFADILPHVLPKGAPRFSRLGECARLHAGTSPLKPAAMPGQ